MSCWIKCHDLSDSLCDGPWDECHFISKQTLRASGDHEYLGDDRNLRRMCRRHHNALDRGMIVLRYGDLPASVHEFAFDLNYKYEGSRAPSLDNGFRKQALVP